LPRQACLTAVSPESLVAPILILGAPRSGTTWLAKIIDSHPDVVYRHEPDEALPGPSPLAADDLPALLVRWAAETGARTVAKRPYFRKSWQPGWARGPRALFATAVSAAGRLPPPLRILGACRIPDLGVRAAPRFAIKSIGLGEGAAVLSRSLPNSRTLFILRHPCAQVASVMRGTRQRRFDLKTHGTDMPFDEAGAIRFAAASGTDERSFRDLPDAAKYAWSWRAFNEPAYAALAGQSNVQVVLYEALCAEPVALARRILTFVGLHWTGQTEEFIRRSTTYHGPTGYYALIRDAAAAAEAWRTTMRAADQCAVRSVASSSPLAGIWPDLMDSA
jgi:Sulfotransferase family